MVRVPPGTLVYDEATGELLADLRTHGERFVVAQGGKGGRGNIHFATSNRSRAPRAPSRGRPARSATCASSSSCWPTSGLLGFPNVGKSTFIAPFSAARPKIADYPFTTLVPNLGVVGLSRRARFVIADIPGLIEGAHEGAGLGHRFLRHVERTRVLVHLLDAEPPIRARAGRRCADFEATNKELGALRPGAGREAARNRGREQDKKSPEVRKKLATIARPFARRGIELHPNQRRHRRGDSGAPGGRLAGDAPARADRCEARPAWCPRFRDFRFVERRVAFSRGGLTGGKQGIGVLNIRARRDAGGGVQD